MAHFTVNWRNVPNATYKLERLKGTSVTDATPAEATYDFSLLGSNTTVIDGSGDDGTSPQVGSTVVSPAPAKLNGNTYFTYRLTIKDPMGRNYIVYSTPFLSRPEKPSVSHVSSTKNNMTVNVVAAPNDASGTDKGTVTYTVNFSSADGKSGQVAGAAAGNVLLSQYSNNSPLDSNRLHTFSVVGVNQSGSSLASAQISKLTAPAGANNMTVSNVSVDGFRVDWTSDATDTSAVSYDARYHTSNNHGVSTRIDNLMFPINVPGGGFPLSTTLSGLAGNTLYYYWIDATNSGGTTSMNGSVLTLPPTIAKTAASFVNSAGALSVTPTAADPYSTSSLLIRFGKISSDPSNGLLYEIERREVLGDGVSVGGWSLAKTVPADGTTTYQEVISGLSAGTNYQIRVRTKNDSGYGSYQDKATFSNADHIWGGITAPEKPYDWGPSNASASVSYMQGNVIWMDTRPSWRTYIDGNGDEQLFHIKFQFDVWNLRSDDGGQTWVRNGLIVREPLLDTPWYQKSDGRWQRVQLSQIQDNGTDWHIEAWVELYASDTTTLLASSDRLIYHPYHFVG